ncbi:MAG: hypothetical protein ACODAC_04280 [Pseudomonadota bacterium]
MNPTVPLEDKVAFLEDPASYPHGASSVHSIETHMSWVFVTDELVYKMKKPVQFSYLDFSTLELRRHDCEESIRLNRRLAGDVYLGVVALTRDRGGGLALEGDGSAVEWLEKMQRLPAGQMLDVVIADGRLTAGDVRRCAAALAEFYARAPAEPVSVEGYRARVQRDLADNRRALEEVDQRLDVAPLARIFERQWSMVANPGTLDRRAGAGRVIEAHGDLRPEHVCVLPEPVFIDCLEFNRGFRIMDVADELSYLAMECELVGAGFVSPILFEIYQQRTGDRVPPQLVHFYKSHRAVVRAKLAAWHVKDHPAATHDKWLGRAAEYLALAERHAACL